MNSDLTRDAIKWLLSQCGGRGWISYQIECIGNADSESFARTCLEFCHLRGFHNRQAMRGYGGYDWGKRMMQNAKLLGEMKGRVGRPDFAVVDGNLEIPPFFMEVKCEGD